MTARLYGRVFAPDDLPIQGSHLSSKSLGTVNAATELEFKKHLHGTDSLRIKINRHHPQAALLQKDRYFVVYSDIGPVGGAFLEEAPIDLSAEDGKGNEWMEWTGRGSIAILERGVMDATSNITGGENPIDGYWDLSNQGPDAGVGAETNGHPIPMMKRVLTEMDLNSPNGIAIVDHTSWSYGSDTDSATPPDWGHTGWGVDVGDDGLKIAAAMSQLGGVVWQMSHLFKFDAYLAYGTDRSGAFGAAGKVRFEKGVNIAAAIQRKVRGAVTRTHLIVGGAENTFVTVVDPDYVSGDVVRWGFLAVPETSDEDALEEAGLAHIALRKRQTDAWSFPCHDHGDSIVNGIYEPGPPGTTGAHFWVGDRVSLHTGTGEYDANEEVAPVAAITWQLKTGDEANGDYWVIPEVGATFHWSPDGVNSQGTPGSQRRINICPGRRNVLVDVLASSIKAYSEPDEPTSWQKEKASDGDDTTHWSGHEDDDPTAEAWWAADIASAKPIDAYRIFENNPGDAPQNIATEVRLYGSNDAAAWAWLTDGGGHLTGDPAANDWTLVATRTNALTSPQDSGEVPITPAQSFRYWLFRAVSGGSQEWDVNEFELWTHGLGGTAPCVARGDHNHLLESLKTAETDTTKALRPDGEGGVEWVEEDGGGPPEPAETLFDGDGPRGTNLTKLGVVIQRGGPGTWNQALVESGNVFEYPPLKTYGMLVVGYEGASFGAAHNGAIGLYWSTSGTPEGPWVEDASNPILPGSGSGADTAVSGPFARYENGELQVFHIGLSSAAGYETGTKTLCLSTTTDILGSGAPTWTRHGPIISPSGSGWRQTAIYHPNIFRWGEYDYLLFNAKGSPSAKERIGYAKRHLGDDVHDPASWVVDDVNSPILNVGDWAPNTVGDPYAYRIGRHLWVAYYGGPDGTYGESSDGLAFCDIMDLEAGFPNGLTKTGAPVLTPGPDSFDAFQAHKPCIWRFGDKILHYYTAVNVTGSSQVRQIAVAVERASGSGVTDHGDLTGLDDDDHTQYLTEERHDAIQHAAWHPLMTQDPGGAEPSRWWVVTDGDGSAIVVEES